MWDSIVLEIAAIMTVEHITDAIIIHDGRFKGLIKYIAMPCSR